MSQPQIRVAGGVEDRLVAMARAALPNEMCGLLYGPALAEWDTPADVDASSTVAVVDGVVPVSNREQSPTTFVLDPLEMLAAEDTIDGLGASVVGVVHSHPTSEAVPSPRDIADAGAYDPRSVFVHFVVSMQGFVPRVRAFRMPVDGHSGVTELSMVPKQG